MLTNNWNSSLARVALAAALCACSRPMNERSASGTLDTSIVKTSAIIDAAGPGVQVTRTDVRSMDKATEYRLTPIEFLALHGRRRQRRQSAQRAMPAMREYLSVNITDAGSEKPTPGSNGWPRIRQSTSAINSGGHVRCATTSWPRSRLRPPNDSWEHPSAAPPTPTLGENAKFLKRIRWTWKARGAP